MALREKLEVIVDANVQGFVRGMDKAGAAADKNLGKTDDKLAVMSGRLTSWGAAMAGAGAVGAVGLGKLAMMAADAEKSQLKLTNSVQNSANSFKNNGAALRDQASELQKYTAAEDDAVVGAQAMLVQFGLTERQVTDLTPLMVDLSRKMGVDLDAAAKAVGKSATGTTTALKRMGIDVNALGEGSTAAEKTISALSKSVGGFAEAEGKTFSGQLQIIKNQLGEIGEGVGSGVIDVVKPFTGLASALSEVSPAAANTAGKILTIGTAGLTAAGGLAFISGQALKVRDAFSTLGADGTRSMNTLGKAAAGFGAVLGTLALTEIVGQIGNSIGGYATKAEDALTRLQLAVDAGADSSTVEAFAQQVSSVQDEWLGFGEVFSSVGRELKVGSSGVQADIENVDIAFQRLLDAGGPSKGQALIDALKRQREQLDPTSQEYNDAGVAIARFQGKVDLAAAASAAGVGPVTDLGDATGDAGDQAEEAASKYTDYANAIKAATDPLFAASDASKNLADAQKGVAEAQAAFKDGATPEEVIAFAAAQREAAKAAIDQEAALAGLRGAFEDGTVEYGDAIALIERLKAQYPELGDALSALGAEFDATAGKALALKSPPPIAITATTTEFDSSIAAVEGQQLNEKNVLISAVLDPFKKGVAEAERTKPKTVKAPVDADTGRFKVTIDNLGRVRYTPVRVPVDADTGMFQSKINSLLSGFRSQAAAISISANPFRPAADGFVSYAGGGTRLPSQAMIQPGRGGGLVQWAEGETGGEAFIPLAPSKRGRSKDLWVETGKRLGILPMADGGIRSFGFGGFTADDYTGQLVEQMNNFWQAQFDSATLGRQAELAATRRDQLQPWSDEWVRWNNIAVDSLQKLAAEQSDIAEKAAADQREAMERNAAAAKDIADNQFDWMYDHASDLEKLQIAISRRDSFGQFTDDWVQWAKEVESLQMAGVGTARSTASGGKSQGSAPFYLTVNVNAEGLVTDPSEVGRQVVGAIRSYEQQNGTAWRA